MAVSTTLSRYNLPIPMATYLPLLPRTAFENIIGPAVTTARAFLNITYIVRAFPRGRAIYTTILNDRFFIFDPIQNRRLSTAVPFARRIRYKYAPVYICARTGRALGDSGVYTTPT